MTGGIRHPQAADRQANTAGETAGKWGATAGTANKIIRRTIKKEAIMLELNWYKRFDLFKKLNKWYVYVKQKEVVDIEDIALHMQAHNTPFSTGTIIGLLNDFVQCVHEQLLDGKTVKINNLAMLSLSADSNAFDSIGAVSPTTGRTGVRAEAGTPDDNDTTQPAIKALRLQATATGNMRSRLITKEARLGWTTEATALMDEERRKAEIKKTENGEKEKE